MIAEPLEKGLAEDIESEVVQITWTKWVNTVFKGEEPNCKANLSPVYSGTSL